MTGSGNMTNQPEHKLHPPRMAAVAGIVFSIMLSASIVLIYLTIASGGSRSSINRVWATGLNLVPFSGLAFLWFLGVLNDQIGDVGGRFFSTVCLGSGLLFLVLLFAAAAVAGGITTGANLVPLVLIACGQQTARLLLNTYAMRMAAVFMISTSTVLLRSTVLPKWLAYVGYVFALIQMVTLTLAEWVMLLFPLWVLLLSAAILATNRRARQA